MTEKSDIRREILRQRDTMTRSRIAKESRAVLKRLICLGPVQRASTMMAYLSFKSEVITDGLILWGLTEGRRIAVPCCDPESRKLTPCLIGGLDEVVAGHYGIREPRAHLSRPLPPEVLDAVIVPAVAFDRRGYRIGYGGGYYDRFLMQAPQAARIGIAFACQIVDRVPVADHDIPMDGIVTGEGVIIPAGGRPGFTF